MNKQKTKSIVLALVVPLVFTVGAGRVAAVDVGIFELDGNAFDNLTLQGDDWDTVLLGGGGSSSVHSFVADPGQSTIFTGGKKDIQDIPEWGWKSTGGFPDKDDITNAYGAGYLSNGDLLVYFGCDRFANNGDAYLAFWFFQDKVSLNPNGTLNGTHMVGDILVLVNFPQATKAKPTIAVARWNPDKPTAAKNLELLDTGTQDSGSASVCSSDDLACAITNLNPENSPWSYTPKSGPANIFPYESFFEGGINLTQLLGGVTTCFSSFMAESRSSEQFTATLKDFVLGDFPVCDISVVKACKVIRVANESDNTDKFFVVDFNGVVTNTGPQSWPVGAVLTVVDDAGTPGDIADDVTITKTLDAAVPLGGSVPFSGEFFSNENPPHNTVRAEIEFAGTMVPADPCSIDCVKVSLNPKLTIEPQCGEVELVTIDSLLRIKVNFTFTVKNEGDVPLYVSVSDEQVGELLAETLMQPGDEKTIDGSYLPQQADGDVNNPCTAMFSDTFTAVGTSSIPGVEEQQDMETIHCKLCACD
jgi:hypothetical protein